MAYVAGWLANVTNNTDLGLKTSDDAWNWERTESLAPWIFQLSRGGLKVPENQFMLDMEKFEKCFIDFHGPHDLRREKNIIRDFEAILVHKFGPSTPYEYETKMLAKFAKARTYFRLRNLIQALKDKKAEENAKNAAKRKVKADAKFQKLVDAEIEKREKATKRQHDETPGTSGTNTAAEVAERPKLAPKKLYKSVKDPRSYKQLGQHTTRNLK